jgi:hypothetical protein
MTPRPAWLALGFAAVMVAVSLYCVGRVIAARRWNRQNHLDVNISHIAMGFAMGGMLVPRANLVPNLAWEVVFASIAAWFLWRSVRVAVARDRSGRDGHAHDWSHYPIHLVMALAMIYMYLAAAGGSGGIGRVGMSMTSGTGSPAELAVLPLLFTMLLLGSAAWQLDGFSGSGAAVGVRSAGVPAVALSSSRPWLAPRLETGCHIAMCLTMGYMLVLML